MQQQTEQRIPASVECTLSRDYFRELMLRDVTQNNFGLES